MKYIIASTLLLYHCLVFAQNAFASVTYDCYRFFLTEEARAMLLAKNSNSLKKLENEYERFELVANATQSQYQFRQIMYKDTLLPRGKSMRTNATIYLDFDKQYLYYTQVSMPDKVGRDTLLMRQDWRMVPGEKEIAGYSCKKATYVDLKGNEIVAWFSIDIPIAQGPNALYGLSGLILGIESKYYTIIAHKVKILAQPLFLKMPTSDKYLTLKAFDEAVSAAMMPSLNRSKK